jgi:hypothetical protein
MMTFVVTRKICTGRWKKDQIPPIVRISFTRFINFDCLTISVVAINVLREVGRGWGVGGSGLIDFRANVGVA